MQNLVFKNNLPCTASSEVIFSIIIVGYKDEQIVLDCINSINTYNDIGKGVEIILVDNSPEHNVFYAAQKQFPDVECIKNINNGFGAGNNLGASQARGKYLLFLNPDTILVEPIFEYAIERFNRNSNLSMFGVKMVNLRLERNASFYLIESGGLLRSIIAKLSNKWDLYLNGSMYIAGSNMFLRAVDFNSCGRFDEKIFMYYEEPDLTLRLINMGKSTAYFKEKKIIHLEGGTTKDNNVALRRRLDSAIYFNRKYSKDPRIQLTRELRLCNLKRMVFRLTRYGDIRQLNSTAEVLTEFVGRLNDSNLKTDSR